MKFSDCIVLAIMNKARAMLDALMGPQRDAATKEARDQQWRDKTMCKSFLVGFCPCDKAVLGGKQGVEVCAKVHSESVRSGLREHEDGKPGAAFLWKCEKIALEDIAYVIGIRDAYAKTEVAEEKERIAKQPKKVLLSDEVNSKIRMLHKERYELVQKIKELATTDSGVEAASRDKMKTEIVQLEKDANDYERDEYSKVMEAVGPKACSTCGSMYKGQEEYDAHLSFKTHKAFEKLLSRSEELKISVKNVPSKADLAALEKKEKEELSKKDAGGKDRRSRSRRRERSQSRERKRGKSRSRGDRKPNRSRSRDRNRDRNQSRDRKDRSRSRDRNRGSAKVETKKRHIIEPPKKPKSTTRNKKDSASPSQDRAKGRLKQSSASPSEDRAKVKKREIRERSVKKAASPEPALRAPAKKAASPSPEKAPEPVVEPEPVPEPVVEPPPPPEPPKPVKMKISAWKPACIRAFS